MLVMNLMGTPYTSCIPVVGVSENLKPLMDKYIMDQEIGRTIGHDTKSDRVAIPEFTISRQNNKAHAYNSIKDKKGVISFKPGVVVFSVVILVQAPEKSMHYIFMGKPGHKFHNAECEKEN
jgi:hypothetical protein